MGVVTKRGLKRKDLIQRIKVLEYALANSIERQRNCELVLDSYIKMNKDEKKFEKFLDKKRKDAEHKQEERKSS
jgi:hypothetical protein|tara:strand:- start:1975 stop:2196 length:222 start_codon:yes stop_codon:yes gene_type:complete